MTQISYSTDRTFSTFRIAEGPTSRKLLDVYRDALRVKHYSPRTEDTYVAWVKNFILFHNKRHPREMGVDEIGQFLTHLAAEKDVSASTHTVLAVGARETRPLAPSYSSIVIHFISSCMKPLSHGFVPSVLRPCPLSSPRKKSGGCSLILKVHPNSSPRSCMAAGCGSWRLCDCVSRILTSTIIRSSSAMERGRMTALPSSPNHSSSPCAFT